MTNYFEFYQPILNPSGLTGYVGGLISETPLLGHLGELFARRNTSGLGELVQYRKFHVKQIADGTFTNLEMHLDNVEHTGQMSMATELFTGDISFHPTLIPSGYLGGDFSGNSAVPVMVGTGSSISGESFGFWLKQTLPAGAGTDTLGSFTVQIRGDLTL
jgi:hypothetical protein